MIDNYVPTEEESVAIGLFTDEINEWENATVWVTDKISMDMRDAIDKFRRNYFGRYANDRDTVTGEKKIWDPITEIMVDGVVQNIDLDPKDVDVQSKNAANINTAPIAREIIKDQLHKAHFGELLDEVERYGALDGTAVVKTFNYYNPKTKKKELRSYWVDLRNFYIDPNATSIQDTGAVIERAVMTINEFRSYGFDNSEFVKGDSEVPVYHNLIAQSRGTTPLVEVYERWGLMPKFCITGNEKDRDEYVEGKIIASSTNGRWIIHEMELNENPRGIKPYEEWQLKKVPNRWYGRGVGEMVESHQLYANIVANMRKNVNLTKGLGLYEIRKGSGIKPSDLKELIESGGILVSQLGADIKPFQDRDFNYQASMSESQFIFNKAQQVTGATDISRGEALPATTTATNAVIQDQALRTRWSFIQESLGRFMQRLIEDHYLPIMRENLTAEELTRITGDTGFIKDFDEKIINNKINRFVIDYSLNHFGVPPQEVIENQKKYYEEKLKNQGSVRFIKDSVKFLNPDYDIVIQTTNEETSKSAQITNIKDVLFNVKQIKPDMDITPLLQEYLDLIGLDGRRLMQQAQQMSPQMMAQGGGAKQITTGEDPEQNIDKVAQESAQRVAEGQTA